MGQATKARYGHVVRCLVLAADAARKANLFADFQAEFEPFVAENGLKSNFMRDIRRHQNYFV